MRTPRWITIAALTVLAAACGTSNASSSFTLRLAGIGPGNRLSGAFGYLQSKGRLLPLLRAAGVKNAKIYTFPNGPDLNQALAGNALDVAIYGDTPALVARGAGQPTRLLSIAAIDTDADIIARKGGPASLRDLRGKKIAVQTGSYMHRYLLGALTDAHVTAAKIVHVYQTDLDAPLARGDIDAAAVTPPYAEEYRRKGYQIIDVASHDHPDCRGTSAAVATARFLKAHPDFVAVWDRAQAEAVRVAKANWSDYLSFSAAVTHFPADITRQVTLPDQLNAEPFPAAGLKLLNGTQRFLVQEKFIKRDFSIDDWIITAKGE
jgi:sulfonate transport system substrate-binding protein